MNLTPIERDPGWVSILSFTPDRGLAFLTDEYMAQRELAKLAGYDSVVAVCDVRLDMILEELELREKNLGRGQLQFDNE